MKSKWIVALLLFSLFVNACAAAGNPTPAPEAIGTVTTDARIISEGRLEPVRSAEIAFTSGGVISDVPVQEGQSVKRGDTLLRLGDASDTNYAAAELELVTAQQALNDLVQSAGADLAQAMIDLKEAKEASEKAANYLDYLRNARNVPQTQTRLYYVQTRKGYEYRTHTKHYKGPAPKDWIIDAGNDLALKTARLEDAQRRYDRLKDGADAEQLAILEARLNVARAKLAAFSVVAPFDGVVAALNARAGSSINAGETAVTVADFSQWLVKTTDLTEIDVVELSEGQPVVVTLDAIPTMELRGNIQTIGQTYTENQGDVVYEVTIVLTDTHPAMRWGMTAAILFEAQD